MIGKEKILSKKLFLVFIMLALISIATFAYDSAPAGKYSGSTHHTVSFHLALIGAEASYEYNLNRFFSVLGDVAYTTLIFMDEFTVSGKGRVYPFGRAFYLELGLGYSYGKGVVGFVGDMVLCVVTLGIYWLVKDWENDIFRTSGFLIQPGLGWKIDIGKPGAFVLPISFGVDIMVKDIPDFLPYMRIGVGYSF